MGFIALHITGEAAPLLVNSECCENLAELTDLSGGSYTMVTIRVAGEQTKRTLLAMEAEEVAVLLSVQDDYPGGTIVLNSILTGEDTIIATADIAMVREIAGNIALIHYRTKKGEAAEYYTDQSFPDIVEMITSAHNFGSMMLDIGFEKKSSFQWLKKLTK